MSQRLRRRDNQRRGEDRGERVGRSVGRRSRRRRGDRREDVSPERTNRRRRGGGSDRRNERVDDERDNNRERRSRRGGGRRSGGRRSGGRSRREHTSEEEEDSFSDSLSEEGEGEGEGEDEESEEEMTEEERQIKKFVGGVKMEHLYIFNESIQEYQVRQRFDDGFMGKLSHDLRSVLNMNREIPEDLMSSMCPGFIFIGMESSGKSSVVCGVVGEPLCDINQGVCTRVPSYITVESDRKKADNVATVLVKHHGGVDKIQKYIKRAHSDCARTDSRLNIWEGWTVNKKINELIGARGSKKDPGADKEPIHFNIKTPEPIFPFFLIDMPGYVGANAGRVFSDKVEEINHDTVQKYVIDPVDSRMYVCVCVEAAQCMSIRRDKFTRIIGTEEETKNCERIIFIFTKCDLFFQKEDIETFLERFAEKGIETSHKGLWDYFTKDILKLYPNAEFFFSACPVLEGVYKERINQVRKYHKAKARIQGELKREKTSRYQNIIEFLRNLHKMKWRNDMEFREDKGFLKKFESRMGLHRLQRMIQLKSRLNDGVKIGEFVHKIMDGKHSEWKNKYDLAKEKLDKEKTNPSPAAEVLGVLKDAKKILYHLFTGRFLKGGKVVKPENNENMFNSLFHKEYMGSKETLIDMVRVPFPQVKKKNLKVFEKIIMENLQDNRCGSLICIGDAICLLLCSIPMEKPLFTNVRELNENTTHDFDSDSRSVRNYFLHRIREFSSRVCSKSFDFIKKIWKLYLKRIYSSLDAMLERHIASSLHERWKMGDKNTVLRKEAVNFSKFVVLQALDIDKMLENRLNHFQNQYLMVPTTYAQTYESFVNIGHRHFRIGGDYLKMRNRVKKQRKKLRELKRKNLELKSKIAPDGEISDEDDDDDDDDDMSDISDDEEEEMLKKKREEEEVDLGEDIDGVWTFKSGEQVYKFGTAKAGKYEMMGSVHNFVDIHGGKYLPQMNMYLKADRTALQAGEYGNVVDGKFFDVHGGWYDLLPDGPHPPLNFGDYHIMPKKEEEPDEEEEEGEGEEEPDDPVQLSMMEMVYRSFNVDGLEKHITGNKITEEEVVNFNKDLERVCHVISVNLANQVYLFQAEMKNLFRPENYGRELDFGFENLRGYLIKKLQEKSTVFYFDHMSLDDLIIERFGLESELKRYQEEVNQLNECVTQILDVNNLVKKYLVEARHMKQNSSSLDQKDMIELDYENNGFGGFGGGMDNDRYLMEGEEEEEDEEMMMLEEEPMGITVVGERGGPVFEKKDAVDGERGQGRMSSLQEARDRKKKERQSSKFNTPDTRNNPQSRHSRSSSRSSNRSSSRSNRSRRGSERRIDTSGQFLQTPSHQDSRRRTSSFSSTNRVSNSRLSGVRNVETRGRSHSERSPKPFVDRVRRPSTGRQPVAAAFGNNNNRDMRKSRKNRGGRGRQSSFASREIEPSRKPRNNSNSSREDDEDDGVRGQVLFRQNTSTTSQRDDDSSTEGSGSDLEYGGNSRNFSEEEIPIGDIGDVDGIGEEIEY